MIAILLIVLIAFSFLFSLPLAFSASPPEPTYGTATVDGDTAEWNLNDDFFANMYRAGQSNKSLESKAYLRYDCSNQTLYVLVLTEPGVPAIISAEDAWAAINTISNKTFNGNDDGGSLPNFAWVGGNGTHALGYEAAFNLAQGNFSIIIHIQVYDDNESQTSATDGFPDNGVPLVINCPAANPAILVNKLISTDNASWNEADTPPGIAVTAGSNVYYQFVVTNIGNVELSNITLTDNIYTLGATPPSSLAPNATYTFYYGPVNALLGQHTNTATATGDYNSTTTQDTDDANFNGTPVPVSSINIVKEVSTDNSTWIDANLPPGINVAVGANVYYRFTVLNNGDVTLENLTLTDNTYTLSPLLPLTLSPNQTYVYYYGPVTAQVGQHTNIATATGDYNGTTVNDTDPANYLGTQADSGDICIKKYISTNRCTWYDANCPPGPTILVGKCIYYKIVVRNTGNVTLSDITLKDQNYAINFVNVTIPSTLQPRESFTVILGPIKANILQQTNNATVTGTYQNTTYSDSDTANYYGTIRTYTACDYRGTGTAGKLVNYHFKTEFSNGLEIGCYTDADGFGYNWTSVSSLKSFLKYTAPSGPINCDKLNPTNLRYGGGTLAVQTAVLSLNIAFQGSSSNMPEGLGGGILYVKDGDSLSGKTVPRILAIANDALGGHGLPEGYTYNSLKNLIENINNAFTDATPNDWAKTYLRINIAG